MKRKEKIKTYLAIGSGIVICIALTVTISQQFSKVPVGKDVLSQDSTAQIELVIDPSKTFTSPTEAVGEAIRKEKDEKEETEEKKLVIQPNTDATAGNLETSKPADTRPAQTDQTEQSIQPEVTKPVEPKETVKTDPERKPDGTKVETPPTPVEHEMVVVPSEPAPPEDEPQAGDKQDGKIYIPGFGWTENNGGGGSGMTAEDMYENGNKIGIMD